MRKTLFCVDGTWYLNRAYSVLMAQKQAPLDMNVAMAGMMLSMVCKDALAVRADYLVVAFDGDRIFRYELDPNYKRSRKEKHEEQNKKDPNYRGPGSGRAVYQYMPAVLEAFTEASIPWVQLDKYEADDICASASAMGSPKLRVILGAGDKDSMQLVNKYVRMYASNTKPEPTWVDEEAVFKKFGVRPDQMIMYQTIVGDDGDDVIGLSGYGPKTVQKICAKYSTIKEWRTNLPPEKAKIVNTSVERLRMNRKLVTLVKDAWRPASIENLRVPKNTGVKNKAYSHYQAWLYPKAKGLFS